MKINLSNIHFKPQKGLTAREFLMIALLIVAVEGYFIFTYVLQPAYKVYDSAVAELESRTNVLNGLRIDFVRKSVMEDEIKAAEEKLAEIQKQLPPYVSQEEVIFFIEDLSQKSGLTLQSVSFQNASELPLKALTASDTMQAKIDTGAGPVPVVTDQKVGVNFLGSYQQLFDFLSEVESSVRKVAVRSITLQKSNDGILNGVLSLSFTSYWDENEGQKPYEMTPAPTPGKSSIFDEYSGYSTVAQTTTEVNKPAPRPDFYLTLNSYLNNSSKIFMMNYYNSGSEAIEDKNEIVGAQMILSEADGKYTYSYKLGTYDIAENEATEIKDGKIRMEVLVQPRQSEQDKVGLILDIDNNTGVPFEITVKGDDPSNPRFITGRTTGSVVVK